MELSLWEILNSAGGAMWVILVFSVLAVAVALERLLVQWKFAARARALADTVSRCLMRGALDEGRSACERSRSPLADVFLVGYERLGRSKPENVDSAVHRERMRVVASLKARMWILGTIGATAPFVGLFGTVVGIMDAFGELQSAEAAGLDAGIGLVSGYISEALVATAAGILVAVEAVIIFNFFNQRLARISMELKMMTDEFLEDLHESGGPGGDRGKKGSGKGQGASKDEDENAQEGDADGAREAA